MLLSVPGTTITLRMTITMERIPVPRGDESYYYKYLVDENAGTFKLVESLPVTYSGYVSSVQQTGGNLIINSGSKFKTSEFDRNHNLIQTLTGSGETWWYRVFKYTYSGYWFA